jgi:hypothetical protein
VLRCWLGQAKLVEELTAMLSGFAQRKAVEVSDAVGEIRAALSRSSSEVTARFGNLTQAADSATATLQVRLDPPPPHARFCSHSCPCFSPMQVALFSRLSSSQHDLQKSYTM